MQQVIHVIQHIQPAGVIIVFLGVAALVSRLTIPWLGPAASLVTLVGLTGWTFHRIYDVAHAPSGLVPLALASAVAVAAAGVRQVRAMQERAHSDMTVGYVFPAALAVVALWLCIALIEVAR